MLSFLDLHSGCLLISVRDDYIMFRPLPLVAKKSTQIVLRKKRTQNLLNYVIRKPRGGSDPLACLSPFFFHSLSSLLYSLPPLSFCLFSFSFLSHFLSFFHSFSLLPILFPFIDVIMHVEVLMMSNFYRKEGNIVS